MGGTNVNLGNIHAGLTLGGGVGLSGGVDLSIDTITLGGNVGIGLNDIRARVGLDEVNTNSQLNANIGLAEIRTDSKLNANVKTDSELNAAIKTDSELNAAIKTDSKVDLGLDNIRIRELPPIDLRFAVRPFRLHLPLNFKFCLEVLGVKLFQFSVCGEGMAISEDYEPHGTERCK